MIRFWRSVFWLLATAAAVSGVYRFVRGLGASTNLTDEFPWGLWIGFDVLVGVGLAAGGFVVAATVHIFQIRRYEPLSRPVVLTAFLGYLLVIVGLLFDLGRPYRIWHPMVMGNPHSVMFEVAMCVMLYTTVLALEFSPLVFKRLNLEKPLRIVRAAYIPLVVLGVLLSTLHQSSLGTLFVIVPNKLYPLWYTPLLPVFFFISAVAGGLSMAIFESFLSWRAFGKRLEHDLLEGIARVIVVALAVLFVWKLSDLSQRDALPLVFQWTPESVMFWGEMGLGVVLPLMLFMMPRIRATHGGLFFAATLTILGFIINRLNVTVTGFVRSTGVNYVPSPIEFAITAGIVALGFALFGLAVQHLDVFGPGGAKAVAERRKAAAPVPRVFPGRALAGLWVILLAGFAIYGFTSRAMPLRSAESATSPGTGPGLAAVVSPMTRLPDEIDLPMGEDSPGVVRFDHGMHVAGGPGSCAVCHEEDFSVVSGVASPAKSMLMETMENGGSCGKCHDGQEAFSIDECEICHREE